MRSPLLLLLFVTLLIGRPAAAFVVDGVADAPDATPGDGLCAASDGACTLRAALEEANALPGEDTVQLAPQTYRRTLPNALVVTDDAVIECPSGIATIDALGLDRVLHVVAGASVQVRNVVVRGGVASGAPGGGGILNEGTLALDDVTVVVNTGDRGAGIRNAGTLTIAGGFIDHNGPGSALLNEGSLVVERATISRNEGLGLENRGTASLALAQIESNLGGIGNYRGNVDPADLTVDRSALVYNGKRGALEDTGNAVVQRSTVSGNQGAQASAVLAGGGGTLTLENVTITDNGSAGTPTAALDGDGTATVRLRNTIVGANRGNGGDPDCRLTVTSLGHNLASCALAAPDPTTTSGDPRLAPLKAWRVVAPPTDALTLAHAPLPGSPAIDAGDCATALPDQRGVDRPQGGQCDIGAVEVGPLCQGGVGIANAHVGIRQRAGGGGTTAIKIGGQLSFANPADPVVDPLADGLQLRVEVLDGAGATLLERTELTEPLVGVRQGCGGWRVVRPGTRFGWRSSAAGAPLCLPGHVGKLVVGLDDQRAKARGLVFKAQAILPRVEAGATLRVTVVLGAEPLGGSTAGRDGTCAVRLLACAADPTLSRFECN